MALVQWKQLDTDLTSSLYTGSFNVTGSIVLNGVSLSTATTQTGSFATTGSNTFVGNQIISGAANITGLLTVQNTITTPSGQYFVAYSDTSTELSWQAPFTPSSPVYAGLGSTSTGTTITNTSTDGNGDALPSKTWAFGMDGTLTAPGAIVAQSFSGSFTGSLQGTSSYALTASYVTSIRALSGSAASFAGTPYSSSVTFGAAYTSNYGVSIVGEDLRAWSVSGKTSAGFTINSNSSVALTGPVYWITTPFNL